MGEMFDPFDLNMDGKVDGLDFMLFDIIFGDDDEKNTPRKEDHWTDSDNEDEK